MNQIVSAIKYKGYMWNIHHKSKEEYNPGLLKNRRYEYNISTKNANKKIR